MREPVAPLVDPNVDIGLLCQVVASATTARVVNDLAAAGYDDIRPSHGYVFQGVLAGDTTTTQLAQRLGVSAQAVSKTVAELEAAGYLERRPDERDGRARTIGLTRRGTAMIDRSRRARAAVHDEIVEQLGTRDAGRLAALLRSVCDHYGALELIATRRVRPINGLL